jgi:hypothetical protein
MDPKGGQREQQAPQRSPKWSQREPQWSQSRSKIDAETSTRNGSKKTLKKHQKMKQNGAQIDDKSMKNRCRNGRRRRDEQRTFEV